VLVLATCWSRPVAGRRQQRCCRSRRAWTHAPGAGRPRLPPRL